MLTSIYIVTDEKILNKNWATNNKINFVLKLNTFYNSKIE